jgi:hypothetical protein
MQAPPSPYNKAFSVLILSGVSRRMANHPLLSIFKSAPEVRGLPSAGVTRVQWYCAPVRLPPGPPP